MIRRALSGLRSASLEAMVWKAARRLPARPVESPRSIFVLRNNDVGDLLVVTPLFDALRRRCPEAEIVAGVGSWNVDVLRGNPHISEVLPVDAPWFNKYERSGSRWSYVRRSPQVVELAHRRFDVGIDVLGSAWGSLLLLRAGIPCRLGVRGYAGGHSAASACVTFNPSEHVGRSALRFAELLGVGGSDLPPNRPQIFLSAEEREAGERLWRPGRRVLVGPGGGLETKRWPRERFAELIRRLPEGLDVIVTGGPMERGLAAELAGDRARSLPDLSLRETFALVAAADLVFCNSSMLLHAAAAFSKPAVVLLGPSFHSAEQHQAQWGYPTSRTLGRDAAPEDALAAAREVGGL